MTELQATRTLVKSPPELWAECSDAASLARHLDRFGEIRITRLDPETAVAWEGERARGTVRIEPAGWGTKVVLTVQAPGEALTPPLPPPPVEVSEEQPEPAERPPEPAAEAAQTPPRPRRFARLMAWLRGPGPAPDPEASESLSAQDGSESRSAPEPAEDPPRPVAPDFSVTAEAEPTAAAPCLVDAHAEEALSAALDSLGQAHHRPYSRA